MAWREPDALRRHQVHERVVLRRQVFVDRAHDFLVRVRTGDLEHGRVSFEDLLGFRAEATGDDDLAVLREASPIASSDSCTAASMKPQVLTTTRSAAS